MSDSTEQEIVVTGKRLQANTDSGWSGGWGIDWSDFWATDTFAFAADGGGGGAAPEEEIVVTAPPSKDALDAVEEMLPVLNDTVVGDFRVTVDGDVVTVEVYDLLSREYGVFVSRPDGHSSVVEPFNTDGYMTPDGFFRADPTPLPDPGTDWA